MEPSALSLLPPLVAIALAIWWRNVLPALFIGVWVGTTILEGGRPDLGLLRLLDTFLFEQLANPDHLTIILFTSFLGAMIGVMSASGGTKAVVDRIAGRVDDRRKGQTLTWLAGLVVFFDDYANTLLIGGTMRPITDRLKISREKLAFLVDATAAPVAGVAIISTWAGFEMGLIGDGFEKVGQNVDQFQLFLETIPYRFYPITMLAFVLMVALTGRDFGSMHRAETEAVNAAEDDIERIAQRERSHRHGQALLMRHALIPLGVLLLIVGAGTIALRSTLTPEPVSEEVVNEVDATPPEVGKSENVDQTETLLGITNTSQLLLIASFLASVAAVFSTFGFRTLSLNQAMDAWVEGVKSMLPAIIILTMAWAIGGICDDQHLNTGAYLQRSVGDSLTPEWMPAIAFIVAAAVAFSTGSSFATMGLLVVPFTELSWNILGAEVHVTNDPLMLATIGSVLAGAIFGDHCSPISDTTVLSSAASDCDHLRHVETQLPYALTVGGISLLLGCLPIGYGLNVWICLLLQVVALFVILRIWGRPPGAIEKQFMPKKSPAPVVAMEAAD